MLFRDRLTAYNNDVTLTNTGVCSLVAVTPLTYDNFHCMIGVVVAFKQGGKGIPVVTDTAVALSKTTE